MSLWIHKLSDMRRRYSALSRVKTFKIAIRLCDAKPKVNDRYGQSERRTVSRANYTKRGKARIF